MKIVFGGANVDSEMGVEMMRGFEWIDYIVHGEAEESFPTLLHQINQNDLESRVPGVSMRRAGEVIAGDCDARPVVDMNKTPPPDYEDYLHQLKQSGLMKQMTVTLYYESSRGCWWGAKHHCTFCGLNATTMAYRKKDSARVYSEIMDLTRQYGFLSLFATDNIFPTEFFGELLPRLAESGLDFFLFYEVKANLTREQSTESASRRGEEDSAWNRKLQYSHSTTHAKGDNSHSKYTAS